MIHAIKKGINILDRIQVTNMAQMQNMFDFPPAPKLTVRGTLDPTKATAGELAGEKLFFGKAMLIVRTEQGTSGEIRITATSEGLADAEVSCQSTAPEATK